MAIQSLPIDWERLLQSDLGLSEKGFRSLLYNRHEMQDGAYLEEVEKKPTMALRAVFENDPETWTIYATAELWFTFWGGNVKDFGVLLNKEADGPLFAFNSQFVL